MPRTSWDAGALSHLARIAALAILAAMAGWVATSTLQQDFAAYFTAGAAVARGLDPYLNYPPTTGGPWDGVAVYQHSRFLYPPILAVLFRPVAALPYAAAKAGFAALSALAALAAWRLVRGDHAAMANRDPDAWDISPWLPLCCVAWPPLFVTLERGQIDLLLLPVLAAAWRLRRRALPAGALLGLALFCKPLLLGVLPLLVYTRHLRWLVATLGALLLLAAVTLVVAPTALSRTYLTEVLPRAARYGEGGPEALLLPEADLTSAAADLNAGMARIDGQGRPYPVQMGDFPRSASLCRLLTGPAAPQRLFSLALFLLLAAPLAHAGRRAPDEPAWYWGALVVAVLAAPVSWAMELVWALPILYLAVTERRAPFGSPAPAIWIAIAGGAALLAPLVRGAWVGAALASLFAAFLLQTRAARAAATREPMATEAPG